MGPFLRDVLGIDDTFRDALGSFLCLFHRVEMSSHLTCHT